MALPHMAKSRVCAPTVLMWRHLLLTCAGRAMQTRAPAPQSNATFADKAQAALQAAGAVQQAGAALGAAQAASSAGNGNLIGGISGAIQAAQARPCAGTCSAVNK